MAPGRLPQGEVQHYGNQQPGRAEGDQRRAPAEALGNPAAEKKGGEQSEGAAEAIYREGRCALLPPVEIGYQGVGGRRTSGFSNPHQHAIRGQLQEGLCHPAQAGHGAPQDQRTGDDPAPRYPVCQTRDRHAAGGVENGECGAGDETDLRVGKSQFTLDLRDENAQQVTISVVQHRHQQQQA
jgi:hypothetical protein